MKYTYYIERAAISELDGELQTSTFHMASNYQYEKEAFSTFKNGIRREWALTNGIGGYAGSSLIGAHNRTHQGYLIASLHPPIERYLVFSKINESLSVFAAENTGSSDEKFHPITDTLKKGSVPAVSAVYNLETSQHKKNGETCYTQGQEYLVSFSYDGSVHYTYQAGDITLKKHICLKHGANVCAIAYEIENNGPDASHNHFTTGYNMVKLAMPEYEASPTKNVKRELPYIRYAEILLNYVEATIELGELKDPNLLTYWNAVRNRAGLKNIEEAYPEAMNDQDKLRDLIHRERRVEFAFEGINFYDSRRWLTAEETEKGDIHGMNIQAKGTPGKEEYPEDFFQRTVIEKRVFTPSFYLFPIPQSAINKNQDLVQNYKW